MIPVVSKSKTKINLFFVCSPLQLVNASEARHQLNLDHQECHLIILDFYGRQNYLQIKKTLELYKWEHLEIISYTYQLKLAQLRQLLKIKKRIKNTFKDHEINNIIIGEYNAFEVRSIVNALKTKDIYLVDDGNGTITVIRDISTRTSKVTLKALIRYYFYSAFGLNVDEYEKIKLFSYYDFLVDKKRFPYPITTNKLELTKALNTRKTKSSTIIYLGNKFVENRLMTEEVYFEILASIIQYLKAKDGMDTKIIYYPHRGESEGKIQKMQDSFDIITCQPELPVELFILQADYRPNLVTTIFSSALSSIKLLFGNSITLCSFNIKPEDIEIPIPRLTGIYDEYYQNGIEVIETDAYLNN